MGGGGIDDDNNWKQATNIKGRFLFPVKAMGIVYRAKFLQALYKLIAKAQVTMPANINSPQLFKPLWQKDCVVNAKAPFGGPHTVMEYQGRYTHKVAISNYRMQSIDEQADTVTFSYKDFADNGIQKQLTLTANEFIRRFEQHILPKRFVKIRHGGYLAHNGKNQRIAAIHQQLNLPKSMPKVIIPFSLQLLQRTGVDYTLCPICKKGKMEIIVSYLRHNGSLVNIKDLTRRSTKNKASPPK